MIKRGVHIFLLSVIFFHTFSFAQTASAKLYLLDNDEADKPKIFSLYQNTNGLILCGTSKGLYRFDGFDFTLYTSTEKINAAVTAIFETKDKRTLLGYSNGNIAELKNNVIQLLNFEEGFPKVAIKSFTQDSNGIVWLGTAGEGIYYIQNNRLYNINEDDGLSDNYVYKLLYFPKKGVVAATDRGINFCTINNGKKYISTYTSKNGLPDNIVRSIFLNNENELWLGMQDAGIAPFNKKENKTVAEKWNYGQVNDLLVTQSKIYAATEDLSLLIFDYNNAALSFNKIETEHSVSKLNCLFKDREGNVWAAGENGLLRISKTDLQQVYKLPDEQKDQVHCLHYTSDAALWFNIKGGLIRLFKKNNEWQHETFMLPGLSATTITALYEDPNNNLWIGTLGKGITVFNHEKKTQYKLNEPLLANNNIITISGSGNVVWISSLEGVVRATFENNKYTFTYFNDTAGIGQKYVYNIFCDTKNRVWFATDGEGITMLDNNRFHHLKNMHDYVGNVVYKITEDRYGNIWYATYDKGIVKYDGGSFTAYANMQGLSNLAINGLLNTGNDIAVLHKNIIDVINPADGNISYIDKFARTLDISTDLNASANDKSGNIYFLSNNTIYSYTVDAAAIKKPAVTIDRVELFLKNINAENGKRFKYDENNLSFYFTGIYYTEPEKIQYQYKLDGYDEEWVNTKDRVKNFPNLPPGDYTFRVRAALNKNFTNAAEASYSFIINKPYWLQAWFIIAAVIVLALLIFFVIKQREKRINNLNKLKNEKIQSQLETLRHQVNPHFLFNSLNILVSEIETDPAMAVTYVEKIADFYRNILIHRDKDLVTLEDELITLNDYFFLQQKRFTSGLDIKVNINPAIISTAFIPPLVLQMLVENAIKHNIISKETPLCIIVKNTDDNCIAVSNNINRKTHYEKSSGLGLQNIQSRYALMQVRKVSIEADEHFFTVKIPLIKNQYD